MGTTGILHQATLHLTLILLVLSSLEGCEIPGVPTNGNWALKGADGERDDLTEFTVNQVITFTCDEGFELLGDSTIVCQPDGSWSSPTIPECKIVQCPPLSTPKNGYLSTTNRDYDTSVHVSCNQGFELEGSIDRLCQSDQTWTGQDASCYEVDCNLPHFQDGFIREKNVHIGDIVHFYCFGNATQDVDSVYIAECTAKQTWSSDVPKCWRKCLVPNISHGVAVLLSGEHAQAGDGMIANNTLLLYQCEVGYHLNNETAARCMNGTLTHVSQCLPDFDMSTAPMIPVVDSGAAGESLHPDSSPGPPRPATLWPMWLVIILAFVGGLFGVLCMGLMVACLCRKCNDDKGADTEKALARWQQNGENQVLLGKNRLEDRPTFLMENLSAGVLLCTQMEEGEERVVAVPKPDELTVRYLWYEHPESATLRCKYNDSCLDATEEGSWLIPYIKGKRSQKWRCREGTIQSAFDPDIVVSLPSPDRAGSSDSTQQGVHVTNYRGQSYQKWAPQQKSLDATVEIKSGVSSVDGGASQLNSPSSPKSPVSETSGSQDSHA